MRPTEQLKAISTKDIMLTIEEIEYSLLDLDRMYAEIINSQNKDSIVHTTLDDLLNACMYISFLEGMKFHRKISSFLDQEDE